ncbi:MON1-like protein A-like protein [Polychytrium aggregatum]|uniref:MON1-like protein A-like protein n=1 Tax=Polychytrium aggregatum TaxID=110093 RepID=UPI0022FE0EA3|nr:MON1-like protein A-like protein [Polychytrium aggregatum]KAI9206828.1 MON1-like protein A-like protein [Polychytrium aggregatum]
MPHSNTLHHRLDADQPPPPPPPSTSIKRMSSMISSNRASESDAKRTAVASDGERLDFKKNFFILSHAGKPIYCRYGDESKLSGHMGVMQAILSFHSTDDDELQSVEAGTHRYVFLRGGPLYLVAVSSTGESETQLRRQLKHLYNQILFILTQSQLEKIFKERENYDLRRLLMGTETFFDNMADQFLQSPGYCLEAIECVKMERGLREQIGKLFSANVPQSLLFGAMFAGDRLVTLIRPKRHTLHPTDIRLITNMVTSSTSFQSVESWTPICLPHFHSRGFLHAYVSFIGSSELYLVLISNDRDAFFSMSAYKDEIVEGVSKQPGLADQLEGSLYEKTYSLKDVGIPGLRHFVYKSKALMQYIQASRNPPYTNSSDYERLLRLYQYSHARSNEASFGVKVGYFAAESESVLAWITQQSELYVTLDPFATKIDAISIAQKLQKWIKAHEELVFLDRAVVF